MLNFNKGLRLLEKQNKDRPKMKKFTEQKPFVTWLIIWVLTADSLETSMVGRNLPEAPGKHEQMKYYNMNHNE